MCVECGMSGDERRAMGSDLNWGDAPGHAHSQATHIRLLLDPHIAVRITKRQGECPRRTE